MDNKFDNFHYFILSVLSVLSCSFNKSESSGASGRNCKTRNNGRSTGVVAIVRFNGTNAFITINQQPSSRGTDPNRAHAN